MSASSVGETDNQTPSKQGHYCMKSRRLPKPTCGAHRTPGKGRVYEMIQGKAFSHGLFTHRGHDLHRLGLSQRWSGLFLDIGNRGPTLEAQYD